MTVDRRAQLQAIAELLRDTGRAHHQAFIAVNGEDPEWPAWYARHMVGRLTGLLRVPVNEAGLAADLAAAEEERTRRAPDTDWPVFYAEWLLDRYHG